MKADEDLADRLDALVLDTMPEGRKQVEELAAAVVNAGGTSEKALMEMLTNSDVELQLRLNICWMIPRLKIAGAQKALKALLSDPAQEIRSEAAAGLGLVAEDEAVEALLHALETDGSDAVRSAALHGLGIRSSPRSAARIIEILQDPSQNPELRADAAEALAHVKASPIVDALMSSLRDESPLVRYSATYALGEQGEARAVPQLRDIVAHDRAITPWGSVASCALRSIESISSRSS